MAEEKGPVWGCLRFYGAGEPEAQALRRGCRADYRVNRVRLKAAWDVFQREWTRRYGGGPCHDDNEDRWRWLVTVAAMEKLQCFGIECFRIKFPHGMDVNQYARRVSPAEKSLQLLVNSAEWLGKGAGARPPVPSPNAAAPPPNSCPTSPQPAEPPKHVAMVVDELTGEPLPIVDHESLTTGIGWAPL